MILHRLFSRLIHPSKPPRNQPIISHITTMGTVVYQEVYGKKAREAVEEVNRELHRLDALWSPYKTGNVVDAIRSAAGKDPVAVDRDTLSILSSAKEYGAVTHGAFDITTGPLIRLWCEAAKQKRPPAPDSIEETRLLVGIETLEIEHRTQNVFPHHPDRSVDPEPGTVLPHHPCLSVKPDAGTVFLPQQGQSIDLGGIGKGFAADRARAIYEHFGIRHALINLGGNVLVLNSKPDGSPWKIAIKDPVDPDNRLIGYVEAVDCSVVTAGVYERFFDYPEGDSGVPTSGRLEDPRTGPDHKTRRFHHIIDPRTGWPAESGIAAVTVVSPSSTRCDALATASLILGCKPGLELCNAFEKTYTIFINNEGKTYQSVEIVKPFSVV